MDDVAPVALVLSSPALRGWESPRMIRLAGVLSRFLPNLPLRNGLDAGKLSHDALVVADYRSDPLQHGWITLRLANFIFQDGAACIADAARLDVLALLLAACGPSHDGYPPVFQGTLAAASTTTHPAASDFAPVSASSKTSDSRTALTLRFSAALAAAQTSTTCLP